MSTAATNGFPLVPLGEVLTKSKEHVEIDPHHQYKQVTIKLWGQGVVLRDEVTGSSIAGAKRYVVRPRQFVLSRIDARNGAFGLVPDFLDGAVVSNDFPAFTPNSSRLLPAFLGWMSKTRGFVDLCRAASEGTTNRVRLKEDLFMAMKIPLPPLPEQRRIVARIEELATRIEEARGLRRQAMEEAEAFFFSSVSNLQFNERDWSTVGAAVLDRKGAVRSGPFGSQLHHSEFVDTGIAAIGTRDVQVNRLVLNSGWYVTSEKFEKLKRYQVFAGDVLATIVGASIGRFCIVPEDVPFAFTTKHIQALTLDQRVANPRFTAYLLNYSKRCRDSLFAQTEGSAQPSLNATKVLATTLPLPPLTDQDRVVAYLDELEAKVNSLKRLQAETAAELDALLPSVLDRAFKGKL